MAILSFDQLYQYALGAGFSGDPANTIAAISLAESGGNTNAYNPNDPAGGSYGITQINGVHPGAASALGDPAAAMALAYQVSNGGTNFAPWSTYTSGAYQPFLPAGSAASTPSDQTAAAPGATQPAGASNGCGSILNPANWFCSLGAFAARVAGRVTLFVLALLLLAGGVAIYALRTMKAG